MADQKVTNLAAETGPVLTDLLYMVDDPGVAPISKKVTMQNVLDIIAFTGFRATMSSSQTFGSGSVVVVQFDTETFDVGGYFNVATYRWTPPAGYVMIYTTIEYTTTTASGMGIWIYKNGAGGGAYYQTRTPNIAYASGLSTMWVGIANGTDFFDVRTRQWSGGNMTVGTSDCNFQGFVIPQS